MGDGGTGGRGDGETGGRGDGGVEFYFPLPFTLFP